MTAAEQLAAALLDEGWEGPPRALVLGEDWHQVRRARQSLLDALRTLRPSVVSHTTVDTIHLRSGARVRLMSASSPERIRGLTFDLVWYAGRWSEAPDPKVILQVNIQMAHDPLRGYDGPRRWG